MISPHLFFAPFAFILSACSRAPAAEDMPQAAQAQQEEDMDAAEYTDEEYEALLAGFEKDANAQGYMELLKQDGLYADFVADHRADVEGFAYSFQRHGDFVAIFLERRGKKFSTTLNLGKTRAITLHDGEPADMEGKIKFSVVQRDLRNDFYFRDSWNGPAPERLPRPRPSVVYQVKMFTPHRQEESANRLMHIDSGESGLTFYNNEYYQREPWEKSVVGAARRPTDDHIDFEGVGATLWTPQGVGPKVLAALQREIAQGWEKD